MASEVGTSPLVAQLLLNRGFTSIEASKRFLQVEKQDFFDPFLLKGMKETIERLHKAIQQQEKILVFGDYDADGVSSTSLMVLALTEVGADVDYYIPNRFTEGYGPNEPALRRAKEEGFQLVVTVDTGIAAVDEAEVAKELDLDFIVTDHHEPPPVLPDAYSIINPKQKYCTYPFKELAGVGVALKVAHALLERVPKHLFDIAVLGTIVDLVPLVEENRFIAARGIEAISATERPGIQALIDIAGLRDQSLTEKDIGFGIGPRLNAAGRLDSAIPAVQLLLATNQEDANELATEIERLNRKRQTLVNEMTKGAVAEVETKFPIEDNDVLIVAKENWNPGVIGIVASRLVEQYYRPTIVMGIDPETGLAKGSARSIDGFDIFKNLSTCRDILPHFGGHSMAAGMTLQAEDIEELRSRLNTLANETLTSKDLSPIIDVELVCQPCDISLETIEEVQQLAPFGIGNPMPKVMLENTAISQIKQIGSDKTHLKVLFEENGIKLDGVGFKLGHIFHEVTNTAKPSVIGELSINEWNGFRKPQIIIDDVAVNEWQLFDCRNHQGLNTRLECLPEDKLLFISFREETAGQPVYAQWHEQIVHVSDEECFDFVDHYVVLLDLPYKKNHLEALFKQGGMPSRIYAVFHHEEKHFFSTIPSRDHFKWFYAFLRQRKTFDLGEHAEKLAQSKGWSKETVTFMADVFSELGFITVDQGMISLSENPGKQDLVTSNTYQKKQEQAALENDLCYSSYTSLRQWFEQIINKPERVPEGVK